MAICESPRPADKSRVLSYLGHLSKYEMRQVSVCLQYSFGFIGYKSFRKYLTAPPQEDVLAAAKELLSQQFQNLRVLNSQPPALAKHTKGDLHSIEQISERMLSTPTESSVEFMVAELDDALQSLMFRWNICYERYSSFRLSDNEKKKIGSIIQSGIEFSAKEEGGSFMMNAVVKPYHEMCLNSSELIVPRDTYQRALHPARVARIAKEFDERVANEPKISFRDGHYYVMDGQNTIAARKFLNGGDDLQIRCKVYFNMTEQEEALLFAQQTGISERLSAGQKLRALIFAGEPAAVAFQQATELAGVHLSFEEGRGKQRISCIATAYHEFIRLGPELYIEYPLMLLSECVERRTRFHEFRKPARHLPPL